MQKIIAVDFDGVIHKYSRGWQDGSIYDKPIENAKEVLEKLMKGGFEVVIFTTRVSPNRHKDFRRQEANIKKWLAKYGFIYGKHWHQITAEKVEAIAYIDDRAIRFTNWQDIKKYFI